eukprot:scaffold152935_cov34-Tisochrysis_lutea.AAC.2
MKPRRMQCSWSSSASSSTHVVHSSDGLGYGCRRDSDENAHALSAIRHTLWLEFCCLTHHSRAKGLKSRSVAADVIGVSSPASLSIAAPSTNEPQLAIPLAYPASH